ncbi:MAG: helix-turn-helix transcriptional regulator [Vicinamibacterales bacterium]
MQYRETAPLPALAFAVDCVWTLEGEAAPDAAADAVLPDGRPELVLHFGDPFTLASTAGHGVDQPAMLFAGQLHSQILLRPTGRIAIVGIRFHPHGAAALLRIPQDQLSGTPLALDAVDPRLRNALAAIDGSGLDTAASAAQHVLASWLVRDRIDPRVAHAVRLVSRSRGRLPIDRIAAEACLTTRHLERRFLQQVGLTPKRLARIARFQHALHLLDHPGRAPRGADAAAECGYADQAHFVRDFKSLAGCPPSQHLLRRAEMTRVFIRGE